jgi:hypothetical protein
MGRFCVNNLVDGPQKDRLDGSKRLVQRAPRLFDHQLQASQFLTRLRGSVRTRGGVRKRQEHRFALCGVDGASLKDFFRRRERHPHILGTRSCVNAIHWRPFALTFGSHGSDVKADLELRVETPRPSLKSLFV